MENKNLMNQKGLQQLCENQLSSMDDVLEELRLVKEENIKLKTALSNCVQDGKITRIIKSNEELICEKQILLLKDQSIIRELTLEEVKKMDLLVKNLNLTRGKSTSISGKSKKLPNDIPDAKLIELVNEKR